MRKLRALRIVMLLVLATFAGGAIFDCNGNSDCEFFCDDD